ncbi:hypothetical protein MRX96_002038 [Rhipicephalus microplus]
MQWLIGATLALLVGITLAVVLLVSWMCVLSELFHDFRQSVLILWDILLRRDPCYRVLCHLACDTSLKVPDYEWYLLWKSGERPQRADVVASLVAEGDDAPGAYRLAAILQ